MSADTNIIVFFTNNKSDQMEISCQNYTRRDNFKDKLHLEYLCTCSRGKNNHTLDYLFYFYLYRHIYAHTH